MHTATPDSTPAPISETGTTSRLVTVKTLATHEPDACPEGGTRYILFHAGDDLEAAGIVIRVGRKILIDMPRYIDWLRSGGARSIRRNVQQLRRRTPNQKRHDHAMATTRGEHPASARKKAEGGCHV